MESFRTILLLALVMSACVKEGDPKNCEYREAEHLPSVSTYEAIDSDAVGPELGTFSLTYYWQAVESTRQPQTTTLYRKNCTALARVSDRFARSLNLEGSGRTRRGKVVNVAGSCDCPRSPCYFSPPASKEWGVGVHHRALRPFRSVAVDRSVLRIGKPVYIWDLDGLEIPGTAPWGGFVHDGCVVPEDTGGSVDGNQIDWFVGRRKFYKNDLKSLGLKNIAVFEGGEKCAYLQDS